MRYRDIEKKELEIVVDVIARNIISTTTRNGAMTIREMESIRNRVRKKAKDFLKRMGSDIIPAQHQLKF